MPPIMLPIIDPLGILSEPASKLARKYIDDDIEFNDPVRDIVIDILDDEGEEEEREAGTTHAPAPQSQPRDPPYTKAQRQEYYYQVKQKLTDVTGEGDSFTCEKNKAIAEQVAKTFAPDNHRLRMECVHNIHDFMTYPRTSEQYRIAEQWLQQHDLMKMLWQAYI